MSISYYLKIDGYNDPVNKEGAQIDGFDANISGHSSGTQFYTNDSITNEYQNGEVRVFGQKLKDIEDPKSLESSFKALQDFLAKAKQGELTVKIIGKWQKPESEEKVEIVKVELKKCTVAPKTPDEKDKLTQLPLSGGFTIRYGSYHEQIGIYKPDYTDGGKDIGGFDFVTGKAL